MSKNEKNPENIEKSDFLHIINNLFTCLQSSPLSSLSFLSNPQTLISICSEVNSESFKIIKQNISKSNSYGLVYSDISESINQMQSDLQKIISNKEKADMKINIVQLLNNEDKELSKLSKLIISYAIFNDNLSQYKSRIENFSKNEKKKIFSLIKYFTDETIKKEENESIYDDSSDSYSSEDSRNDKEIIAKQEQEIEALKKQNLILTKENALLEKQLSKCIIKEKEIEELREKGKLYDKLINDNEKLKESSKEKENLNESLRTSFDTNPKWDLSEQEYLKIILKKDAEIQQLKDLLSSSQRSSPEQCNNNNNNTHSHNSSLNCNNINEIEENYQKEIDDINHRYETEFELISSALYNIGLCYHKLKNENNYYNNDTPSWLVRNRQQFLNGDC